MWLGTMLVLVGGCISRQTARMRTRVQAVIEPRSEQYTKHLGQVSKLSAVNSP